MGGQEGKFEGSSVVGESEGSDVGLSEVGKTVGPFVGVREGKPQKRTMCTSLFISPSNSSTA